MDHIQTTLDVVELIPAVGDVANGTNAVISTTRGDYKDAALSALAALPVVGVLGEGAKGAKLLKEGEEAVSVYKKAETAYVGITNNMARREAQHGVPRVP